MSNEQTGLSGLALCPLHKNSPFGIRNVSQTQFSIARHFGGIKYNEYGYSYLPLTDELIRDDVLSWKRKRKRESRKKAPVSSTQDMFVEKE